MNIIWILIASTLGFSIAAIFAGLLKLHRNIYLIIYIPLILALFIWFVIAMNISVADLFLNNWSWGLIGAVIAGAFVIKNVYSQPSSEKSKGIALIIDIIWPGLIYGLTDALLLSVLPILSINLIFSGSSASEVWYGKIGIGILALLASFLVTTAYHLGYPEFRGKQVIRPNIGNGVLSLAYILTLNPLAAILPHMAMHVAAMIHGKDTTGQVPPHYKNL
jgi:hypothetical protein